MNTCGSHDGQSNLDGKNLRKKKSHKRHSSRLMFRASLISSVYADDVGTFLNDEPLLQWLKEGNKRRHPLTKQPETKCLGVRACFLATANS